MLSNISTDATPGASSFSSAVNQVLSFASIALGIGITIKKHYQRSQALKKEKAILISEIAENNRLANAFNECDARFKSQNSSQVLILREIQARAKEYKRLHPQAKEHCPLRSEVCDDGFVLISSDENDDPKDVLEKLQKSLLDDENFLNEIDTDLFCEQREVLCASKFTKMTR